ncbi:MAG: hypothetical protein GWN58_22920 [Anaerolineae bacterium]|nr:hypothetical protein [Thermoplasmata archaeon]NIV32228.1 hypothetical protein [Anaerolineae bacterium]NIY03680.1 hypothetical protein [Thermoplasmata archaeon]
MKGPFAIRKLGFTGTRNGLSENQRAWLAMELQCNPPDKAAHGDCVGADADFHSLVRLYAPKCEIHIWPSLFEKLRAHCHGDVMYEPGKAGERDKLIVKFATHFVGCPPTDFEVVRSGSWQTLRMARNRLNKGLLKELHWIGPKGPAIPGDWRQRPDYRPPRGDT